MLRRAEQQWYQVLAPRAPDRMSEPRYVPDISRYVHIVEDCNVVLYWRPGCGFCAALERGLTKAGVSLEKRNIWDDPEAATFVRSVARGHETVPTVVVGGRAMVNPSVDVVLEALSAGSAIA